MDSVQTAELIEGLTSGFAIAGLGMNGDGLFQCGGRAGVVPGQPTYGAQADQSVGLTSKASSAMAESPIWLVAVVITSLEDLHLLVIGAVHQSVFVVDAAGPVAGQVTFQGFRLSYPGEWVTLDLTDKARNSPRHLPVCAQPVQEVFPCVGVEVNAPHYSPAKASSSSMVLTTVAWPDLSRATASMSRRALAGDRSR